MKKIFKFTNIFPHTQIIVINSIKIKDRKVLIAKEKLQSLLRTLYPLENIKDLFLKKP